jgi:hypothetical protein
MAKNRLSLGMDLRDAIAQMEDAPDAVEDGASRAVKQLAVLAEGPMKKEAPEGTGRDKHLRDTIDTKFRRNGLTANVGARKRTSDGELLAAVIVEVTDATSYLTQPPYGPLVAWADAKLGEPGIGYYLAEKIGREGHETLPNDYVDRSLDDWEGQVGDVAGDAVRDALSRLMRGAD